MIANDVCYCKARVKFAKLVLKVCRRSADTGVMAAQVITLTPPERQALSLAARGYSTKESAIELGKSAETIKAQLGIARLKLGAKNSTHAVVIALNDGLIAA